MHVDTHGFMKDTISIQLRYALDCTHEVTGRDSTSTCGHSQDD